MQRVVKLFTLPRAERGDGEHITALDCRENVLFVGTSGGSLQKWQLDDQDSANGDYISRQLIQVQLKKKAVQQLILDPTWPRVFVLCEEQVTAHSTEDLMREYYIPEGDGKATPLKGCTCIAVSPVYKGVHRICVATKRKLLLYTYKQSSDDPVRFQVLMMPAPVMALAFQREMLCLGYTKEYSLVNCYTGRTRLVFNLSVQQPQIKSLDSEQSALCCVGARSVNVSLLEGDAKANCPQASMRMIRETIRWSSEPRAIGFKHPYVVGLLQDRVEVYSMYEGEVVQHLTNLNGATLASCRTPGPADNLYIATDRDAYMLVTTGVDDQVKQLISKLMVDEASDLLQRSSTGDAATDQRKQEVMNIDAGFAYLFTGQADSAFKHFAATDIDVREILTHFEGYLPNCLCEGWTPNPAYTFNDRSVPIRERYAIMVAANANEDYPRAQDTGRDTARTNPPATTPRNKAERDKEARLADAVEQLVRGTVNELLSFMNVRKASAPAIQQRCMDYASLYIYIERGNKEATYHLLNHANHCGLRECEELLKARGLWRDLAWLYYGRGMYGEAAGVLDKSDTVRRHVAGGDGAPARVGDRDTLAPDLDEVFAAVDSRDPAYLKKVVTQNPEKVALHDSMGNTPLHYAATLDAQDPEDDDALRDRPDQVALLGVLMTHAARTDTPNNYGVAPLDAALDASERSWGIMKASEEIQTLLAGLPRYAHPPEKQHPSAGSGHLAKYLAT